MKSSGTSVAAACLIVMLVFTALLGAQGASAQTADTMPIKHVVVIMQENHSFDNYFGTFPGVNGLQNAPASVVPKLHWITGVGHDICHLTPCMQMYYDGGKMDGWNDSESFGYYNATSIGYYWSLASNYTLFDNYFQGFMGPSLPNRVVLMAGSNYGDTNDTSGFNGQKPNRTILDLMNQRGITWRYYDGFCCALNDDDPLPIFAHPQRPSFYNQFWTDLSNHTLPDVSYIMPASAALSEHSPGNVTAGMLQVKKVIQAIQDSPYWSSSAIILTWDESGGFYDHVAPPNATFGFRVPLLVVSPYAKNGFVDHRFSSHSSTLAFIESIFHLPCMVEDCRSSNLMSAFNLPVSNFVTTTVYSTQPATSTVSVGPPVTSTVTSTVTVPGPSSPYSLQGTSLAAVLGVGVLAAAAIFLEVVFRTKKPG